jgi:hypothetical protein
MVIGQANPWGASPTNKPDQLEPDRDQLEMFVDALLRHRGTVGYLSFRSFLDNNKVLKPIRTVGLAHSKFDEIIDIAVEQARRAAQNPQPAVFCPPIAVFGNSVVASDREGWQAREQDLLLGLVISVECDQHPDEARAKLEEILGPATVVVKSGGQWINGNAEPEDKLHLHWRLAVPAKGDDLKKLKQARKLATAIVGGDASNVPSVHCLRWPGSYHRKSAPRLCKIVHLNADREVHLDEALRLLIAAAPPEPPRSNGGEPGTADPAEWGELTENILAGRYLHLSTLRLTAKKLAAGMKRGAVVNEVRELMNLSAARKERPEEWQQRYDDIPRLVDDWVKDHPQPEPAGDGIAQGREGLREKPGPDDRREVMLEFDPAPYNFPDPAKIPPRQWLYGRHYMRGVVSVTMGAPGRLKSTTSLT